MKMGPFRKNAKIRKAKSTPIFNDFGGFLKNFYGKSDSRTI